MLFAPRILLDYLMIRRRMTLDYASAPLVRLLGAPRHPAPRPRSGRWPPPPVLRAIRLAERLAPRLGLLPDTCLFRALTRYEVLRRGGYPVTFCMGVRPEDTADGHAWVELNGRGVLEPIPHELLTTFHHP